MLEKLAPQAGEKILDIGAGSGRTPALLAHIVGVTGIVNGVEIDSAR
jgi:protein-L-isoaspartate(D-aspartate) O-methyltransferase